MKYRIVTNESFEKYIDYMNRGRGCRFEDRWDSLDLDDITADVKPPSDSEVNAAVRELDLFDDAAIKTGAKDVDVAGDGRLRLLDLDEEPVKNKSNKQQDDLRYRELDLDDKGQVKNLKSDEVDDRVRELDYDDKGADIKKKSHNIGDVIGALDYDDDVDMSNFAASIDDVYTALASNDHRIVKAMIKRYANDIDDVERIKEIMLMHAVRLNYECLRALCGDMKITLLSKEKELGFIDRSDIKDALERFKKIASTLTGANNTFGLIPNAIVSCDQANQINCVNIIDFLVTWCELPLISLYFRGAMTRKLYDVALFILNELPENSIDVGLLVGPTGLLTRVKNYDDIPKNLLKQLCNKILNNGGIKKWPSRIIGDMLILCMRNRDYSLIKDINFESNKGTMIANYVKDNDAAMWEELKDRAHIVESE